MVVIAVGVLLLAFLAYGATLLRRMATEDPATWPLVRHPAARARFRIHPCWVLQREIGIGLDSRAAPLPIRTGVPDGLLIVESTPRLPGEDTAGARLSELTAASGIRFDRPEIEPFMVSSMEGARMASAGTLPDGERGYFEFHLVRAPGRDILLRYRCPVLSGSLDSLALSRSVASLEID